MATRKSKITSVADIILLLDSSELQNKEANVTRDAPEAKHPALWHLGASKIVTVLAQALKLELTDTKSCPQI